MEGPLQGDGGLFACPFIEGKKERRRTFIKGK